VHHFFYGHQWNWTKPMNTDIVWSFAFRWFLWQRGS
jgi:hypothetical protein